MAKTARSRQTEAQMPDRKAILQFLAENPARSTKRDLAKAFGIKGTDRPALKRLLQDLESEGLLERDRKVLRKMGTLPPVTVLDISGRDADGGLIAQPAQWDAEKGEPPRVALRSSKRQKGPAAGVGSRVLARVFAAREGASEPYTASVIKILEKDTASQLGVYRKAEDGTGRVLSIDKKRRDEWIVAGGDQGGAKNNDLVEIEPARGGNHGLQRARIVKILGPVEGEKAISMIAIHSQNIPHIFPDEVLEEARAAKPATMKDRDDWRSIALLTIDPADAKDHDDAVFAEPDTDPANPGGHILCVAIADVSHYVRYGSAMDREALKRSNSVYFPDRVVPMLPERISNDLCSLRAGQDRPALGLRIVIAADGRKKSHRFHRVMMKSHASLSYIDAQNAIDGKVSEIAGPVLETVLKPLWQAYASLKKGRDRREPLELDVPERKILLKEDGTVDRVIVPDRLDAHKLIEEFMIQSNVAAAETLEKQTHALLYRVHGSPSLAKQEGLREFLRSLEISLAKSGELRPSHFNAILRKVSDGPHDVLVNEVVLRSQSQALYAAENDGHFGLNLQRYAHFTSPIRRYADLIVHRALVAALGLGEGGLSAKEIETLDSIAETISLNERRAMAAERETVDRLVAHHLADRVGASFKGRISGVTRAGLFVSLPEFGADGFVPISTLGREYYVHEEAGHALIGQETGLGYRLGDSVELKLVEAVPLAGAMRFEILSEGRKLPSVTGSFHKTRGRNGAKSGQGRPTGKKPGTRGRRKK